MFCDVHRTCFSKEPFVGGYRFVEFELLILLARTLKKADKEHINRNPAWIYIVYSHLMQIYFKTPQDLFHITTLFHFAVS